FIQLERFANCLFGCRKSLSWRLPSLRSKQHLADRKCDMAGSEVGVLFNGSFSVSLSLFDSFISAKINRRCREIGLKRFRIHFGSLMQAELLFWSQRHTDSPCYGLCYLALYLQNVA